MTTTRLRPTDEQQVAEVIAWACGTQTPLEIVGGGSKRNLGRPVQAAHSLETAALSGIELYEPNELVMTVKAGTPRTEIEAMLAAHGQRLAFEPPDYGPLLGGAAGQGTIAGIFACNLGGPARLSAGAARDHILGVRCVSGRGEPFKAGGRVVKNVTGFDLAKLLCGSYGTLAVITAVSFKVLPRPEKVRTVLIPGLDAAAAVRAMAQALQGSYEVSGAAYLPQALAAVSPVSYVAATGSSVTAIRLEGPVPSVAYRCAALRSELATSGETEELHSANSAVLWCSIRDVQPFVGGTRAVWRLAVPPSAAAAVAEGIDAAFFFDRGGGQVWLAAAESESAAITTAATTAGGTATLVRGSPALRAHAEVFQPLVEPLRQLTRRVKEAFDPRHILNPGRMYAGL